MGIKDWLGRNFGRRAYSVQLLVADDGFMVAPSFTGGNLYQIFTQAIWTYICASRISQDISNFPAIVQTRSAAADPWITDHEHNLNKLLERPYGTAPWAPRWNWAQTLATGVLREELGGNQFYRIEASPDGRLLALMLYLAELQADVDPQTGFFTEYKITGTSSTIAADRVVNVMHANPSSFWSGVSPVVAAEQAIRIDYSADRRTRYDLETRVAPGIVFKIKALFTMSDTQREKTLTMLEDTYEGAVNQGKSLVVGDDAQLERAPEYKVDDIPTQAARARDSIISAFDISPPMVGVLRDAKYTNWTEAKRAQFNNCLLPRLRNIYGTINSQAITPIYGPDVRLAADLVQSPLGLAALTERGEAAAVYQGLGWPAEQLNDKFGLEMPPFKGWDKPNMSLAVAGREDPADDDGEPDPDTPDEDGDTDSEDE